MQRRLDGNLIQCHCLCKREIFPANLSPNEGASRSRLAQFPSPWENVRIGEQARRPDFLLRGLTRFMLLLAPASIIQLGAWHLEIERFKISWQLPRSVGPAGSPLR